jgi:hypothetical protein
MDGPTGANAPITAGNPAYAFFAVWSSNVAQPYGQRVWSQDATNFETYTAPWGTQYDGGSYVVKVQVNNNMHVSQVIKL